MKNIFPILTIAAVSAGLSGCAGFQTPTSESLGDIPVVEFGQTVPSHGDFILHFLPGKPIPVVVAIKGSALSQEAESTLNVAVKKDIYAYKKWVSFDRVNWQKGSDVLGFNVEIKIPGPNHPEPGLIRLQVDLK